MAGEKTGFSLEDLLKQFQEAGSISAQLMEESLTGDDSKILPLVNYEDFANHIFFNSAEKRFQASLEKIRTEYPIGASGSSTSWSSTADAATAIAKFQLWNKTAYGFEKYVIERMGHAGNTAVASAADNSPLYFPIALRTSDNVSFTGAVTAAINSVSGAATAFDEGIREVNLSTSSVTSISADYYVEIDTFDGPYRDKIPLDKIQVPINRDTILPNLIPDVYFNGDVEDESFEKLLSVVAQELDRIKEYIDQFPNLMRVSYDPYDRVPNQLIPVFAKQFGIDLFENSLRQNARDFLAASTSGNSTRDISYEIWNRFINSMVYLLKAKGTEEALQGILRTYGIPKNFVRVKEYDKVIKPTSTSVIRYMDVPVLRASSTGVASGGPHVSFSASSSSGVCFSASSSVTFQARVSISCLTDHKVLYHPDMEFNLLANGGLSGATAQWIMKGTTAEVVSNTGFLYTGGTGEYLNLTGKRVTPLSGGISALLYVKKYTSTISGSNDYQISTISAITGGFNTAGIAIAQALCATPDTVLLPNTASFSGFMHEIRFWSGNIHEEDLNEHTRNFESVSLNSSTGSDSCSLSSLRVHFKLRENKIFDQFTSSVTTYAVNSACGHDAVQRTDAVTGTLSGFGATINHYYVEENMRKEYHFIDGSNLVESSDFLTVSARDVNKRTSRYLTIHFSPINAINDEILDTYQDLNVLNLIGDPRLRAKPTYWHTDIHTASGTPLSAGKSNFTRTNFSDSANLLFSRFNQTKPSMGEYMKAVRNFSFFFSAAMPIIQQFIPARAHILSQGVLIEPHLFERSKVVQRDFSIVAVSPSGYTLNNRVIKTLSAGPNVSVSDGDVRAYNTPNTATFQSTSYNKVLSDIQNSVGGSEIPNVTRQSTRAEPLYIETRVGRFLPIEIFPFEPEKTVLDIDIDNVILSPSAVFVNTGGFIEIKGTVRIRKRGKSLKVFRPAVRFEFPTTADQTGVITNVFTAKIGDSSVGEEVEVKDADTVYESTLSRGYIDFKINLATASASSLTGTERGIIAPLRVINLLSRVTNVYNIAVSDNSQERGNVTLEPSIVVPESNL